MDHFQKKPNIHESKEKTWIRAHRAASKDKNIVYEVIKATSINQSLGNFDLEAVKIFWHWKHRIKSFTPSDQ